MSTLQKNQNLSVGVYGNTHGKATVDFFKTTGIFADKVSLFEYTHREALFFDQNDIFIITDFGKPAEVGWNDNNGYWLKRLNELREIIWSRSMKSIIFANHNDADVYKSLRDACTDVIEVETISNIPQSFAIAVLTHFYANKHKESISKPLILNKKFQGFSAA